VDGGLIAIASCPLSDNRAALWHEPSIHVCGATTGWGGKYVGAAEVASATSSTVVLSLDLWRCFPVLNTWQSSLFIDRHDRDAATGNFYKWSAAQRPKNVLDGRFQRLGRIAQRIKPPKLLQAPFEDFSSVGSNLFTYRRSGEPHAIPIAMIRR